MLMGYSGAGDNRMAFGQSVGIVIHSGAYWGCSWSQVFIPNCTIFTAVTVRAASLAGHLLVRE
jgi:hypothetical protein